MKKCGSMSSFFEAAGDKGRLAEYWRAAPQNMAILRDTFAPHAMPMDLVRCVPCHMRAYRSIAAHLSHAW